MNKHTLSILHIFLIILILPVFTQCNKKETNGPNSDSNTVLKFTLEGITESSLPLSKSANTESPINMDNNYILKDQGDFETLNYFEIDQYSPNRSIKRLAEVMKSNITYRVELFELNGTNETYVATLNLMSGAAGNTRDTVSVNYGKSYKWYAYSYNMAESIQNPHGSIAIPMGENKDFLYKSGQITINQLGRNSINILFERKTARVAIDIDARGANADAITSLEVSVPNTQIKTGTFNLKNQSINNLNAVHNLTTNLSLAKFENVDGVDNNYRKVAYLHSVEPIISATTLSYTVNSMQYSASNGILAGASGAFAETKNISNTVFEFDNVSIQVGQSGRLKADFLAKGIEYGGKNWAPANLYLHDTKIISSTSKHLYRFYPHNNQTTDYRTFFSYRGVVPLHYSTAARGSNNQPIDICNWVYPFKRWRTPTNEDFNVEPKMVLSNGLLGNVGQLLGDLLNQLLFGSTGVLENTNTSYATGEVSIKYPQLTPLSFPMNNMLPATSLVGLNSLNGKLDNYLLSLDLFKLNNNDTKPIWGEDSYYSAHLWTFNGLLDLSLLNLNIIDVGAQNYMGLIRKEKPATYKPNPLYPLLSNEPTIVDEPLREEVKKAYILDDVLNISLLQNIPGLNLNVIKSNFKNIRCIRNSDWNTLRESANYNPNPVYNFTNHIVDLDFNLLSLDLNL